MRYIAALLIGVLALPASVSDAGYFGGSLVGGGGGGTPGLLSTFAVTNDGGGTQAAGTPTETFGLPFKDGDMCSGAAPILKAGSTVQGYSYGLRRYFSSGCLAFVAVRMLPTFSLAAAGSQNIDIYNAGAWPSASSRTTAEIMGQGLRINAPPVGVSGDNLTGTGSNCATTCGGWLSDATTHPNFADNSANLIQSYCYMDGDAGKDCYYSYWMSGTAGGTQHGQLVADFYVQALNTTGGGLGGFRWFGAIRQPFYNLTDGSGGVPTKATRAFKIAGSSGIGWAVGAGSVTQLQMPLSATSFSVSGAPTISATSTAGTGWYSGSMGQNIVPSVLTTTGSLPGGVNANTIYFVASSCPCPTPFNLVQFDALPSGSAGTGAAGVITLTSAGSGTHTMTPVAAVNQFTKIQFADASGKYLFFQGSGSVSVETTARVKIDQSYWQGTGLIPPYNLSEIGTGHITDVVDPGGASWNYDYWYGNYGLIVQQTLSGTGDTVSQHGDLGPIPNTHAIDFFVQSTISEKASRAIGLGAALQGYDFKDATSKTIVDLHSGANGTASNYGLSASVAGDASGGNGVMWGDWSGGFTRPPFDPGPLGFESAISEHRPQYAYWPYLRFGELQYLHNLIDTANGGMLSFRDFARNRISFLGATEYGLPYYLNLDSGETRTLGWMSRDVILAANIVPYDPASPTATIFDGTKTGKYFNDMAAAGCTWITTAMNPANTFYQANSAYILGRSLFMPGTDKSGVRQWMGDGSGWQRSIYGIGWAFAAAGPMKDANCKTALGYLAADFKYVIDNFGGWHLGAYYDKAYSSAAGSTNTLCSHCLGPTIADDAHWGVQAANAFTSMSWSTCTASSSVRCFSKVDGNGQYTFKNGDKFIWQSSGDQPSGLTYGEPYYVVDLSGNNFNMSSTYPTVNRANVAAPGTMGWGVWMVDSNPSTTSWAAFYPGASYPGEVTAIATWGVAIDPTNTNWSAVRTDQQNRLTANSITQYGNDIGPRYTFQTTFH